MTQWQEVSEKFISIKCKNNSQQKFQNLSSAAARGLAKLLKRIREGEIVISQSDKSKELLVNSMESYLIKGRCHTEGNRELHCTVGHLGG